MCRSIKVLRRPGEPATKDEVAAAALQFVRKISGTRKPSKANQAAFERAVREITESGERLLKTMTAVPPRRAATTAAGSAANPAVRVME
jgi:hypothetical protein